MTTPKVQYGYADGTGNTIRPVSITYPNGRVITYDYGTPGGINDRASTGLTVSFLSQTVQVGDIRLFNEQCPVVIQVVSKTGKDVKGCDLRQDVTDRWGKFATPHRPSIPFPQFHHAQHHESHEASPR